MRRKLSGGFIRDAILSCSLSGVGAHLVAPSKAAAKGSLCLYDCRTLSNQSPPPSGQYDFHKELYRDCFMPIRLRSKS